MPCSIAPGKVILFGEHFVVEGYPAIGLAVGLYASTCVEKGEFKIYSRQLGPIDPSSPLAKPFLRVLEEAAREFNCGRDYTIYIDSGIPVGAGMGSSAAVNVSLTHSLLHACGAGFTREDVSRIAYMGEVEVHGKPSGIDNTLATYGGLVYYKRGSFKRLDTLLPEGVELVVADTGVKRDTGVVVRDVLEKRRRLGRLGGILYEAAGELVEEALAALRERDVVRLGELMTVNHGLLFSMGASAWVNDYLVHRMLGLGAYGAKLSGAGRGGIVIGLAEPARAQAIVEELEREGVKAYRVKPDYEGVRLTTGSMVEPGYG
ncbi:mevalonate kinase [Desulfurococcus mucosus]|uniref:Mevalonate kinase n=1 Tax=Desulfurococcus mucosus (strain ATCC 35584 / DSM 2162 / JCM 9187 / O7/1) TaxID=765177 RepID=E8R7Z1_DESM0|nr:mevalonate kinase [Desulfurococcus mucosus]ADV64617.1 mevalonate kinase [Desulfurococcus mucosus DSM 2162]